MFWKMFFVILFQTGMFHKIVNQKLSYEYYQNVSLTLYEIKVLDEVLYKEKQIYGYVQ